MATDRNKKTLRTFKCRDYLWEYFEQMGNELDCSVDYLINEAMRQYARARVQAARGAGTPSQPSIRPASAGVGSGTSPGSIPSIRTTGSGSHPSMPSMPATPGAQAAVPVPRPSAPGAPPPPPSTARASDPGLTPVPRRSDPPPLPAHPSEPPTPIPEAHRPALYVIFNGQKIVVDKDEFIVGRGAKYADLPIKDGNISRRHAAIIHKDGQYFMKDLGSTNGVEFAGERVDVRRIDEGDVFHMCDYELRFTYR
jgi:hypothetical protein